MIDIKKLKQDLAKITNDAKTLMATMEGAEAERTPENREKFEKMLEDGKALRKEIENAETLGELAEYSLEPAGGDDGKPDPVKEGGDPVNRKSFGQQVIESQQFKNADKTSGQMSRVPVPNLLAKAIFNTTDAQGGYAVRADRETDILDIARQRPPSVLDLINIGQTSVDAVEYILMATRDNQAAPVLEWDAAITPGEGDYANKFGDKPQGDLTLDLKTAAVKTIAEWIPASRQILNDAPNLRGMIDNELMYQIEVTLENEILVGSGSGVHFTGIKNWSGIQTRTHQATGARGLATDNMADTIRRAITDVRLEFYEPDGIVINPAQGETLELEKDDNGNYLKVYDPVLNRIWRVKVVETQAMTTGFCIVGQYKLGAKMWDREQSNIRVGEPGNFFLQNAVAILAELRAAFAVTRPKAFELITW
jgi:HK97 family phage major capsid protein